MFLRSTLLLVLALAIATPAQSQVQTWHVTSGHDETEVRFHSKATLESFEGKSRKLSGFITLDPADLGTLEAELVADLASLDTGLGLRNKHMKDNVLHTKEHPTATFRLEACDAAGLERGKTLETAVQGTMTLHGTEQRMEAHLQATWQADGNLAIVATFPVKLSDYGIKRPKMLMMKVAETVNLTVRAVATPGPAPKRMTTDS